MRIVLAAALLVLALSGSAEAQMLGELRGGIFASAVDDGGPLFTPGRLEDANVEFLFKPLLDTYVAGSFSPHVGVTANFGGESFGYAGLTYHLPVMVIPVFVEAGLGAALGSNALSTATSGGSSLNCSVLVHAEGSVGFDYAGLADVMLTAEHYFPTMSCGTENGTTNVGVRLGLSF